MESAAAYQFFYQLRLSLKIGLQSDVLPQAIYGINLRSQTWLVDVRGSFLERSRSLGSKVNVCISIVLGPIRMKLDECIHGSRSKVRKVKVIQGKGQMFVFRWSLVRFG